MSLILAINWQSVYTGSIRPVVLYYTLVSLIGVLVNLWAAYDSRRDLAMLRRAKINSLIEKTGKISYRDAYSIFFMHIIFLTLGIISLTSPSNTAQDGVRAIAIVFYVFLASIAQTTIVVTQCMNQYDRISIRNQLIAEAREAKDNA